MGTSAKKTFCYTSYRIPTAQFLENVGYPICDGDDDDDDDDDDDVCPDNSVSTLDLSFYISCVRGSGHLGVTISMVDLTIH